MILDVFSYQLKTEFVKQDLIQWNSTTKRWTVSYIRFSCFLLNGHMEILVITDSNFIFSIINCSKGKYTSLKYCLIASIWMTTRLNVCRPKHHELRFNSEGNRFTDITTTKALECFRHPYTSCAHSQFTSELKVFCSGQTINTIVDKLGSVLLDWKLCKDSGSLVFLSDFIHNFHA